MFFLIAFTNFLGPPETTKTPSLKQHTLSVQRGNQSTAKFALAEFAVALA